MDRAGAELEFEEACEARKKEVQLKLTLMEASTVPPIVPDSGGPFGPRLGRNAPSSVAESIPLKIAPFGAWMRGSVTVGGTSIPSPVPHSWDCTLSSFLDHSSILLVFLLL